LSEIYLSDDLGDLNLTATDFANTLGATISTLLEEQSTGLITGGKISNKIVELQIPEKLVIIGDVHGDLQALNSILRKIKIEKFVLNHNNKIIFLGDYVDRGLGSVEVLHTICSLKIRHPHSVVLMRGNHEAPIEFPISSHDLPKRMAERFGRRIGAEIYQTKIMKLFQLLYLITIVEGELFLVHGGVPTDLSDVAKKFNDILANEKGLSGEIMEEILWNDPRTLPEGKEWENSRRGLGKHFSLDVTKKWLSISNTKVIVRGHEPCNGFKLDHDGRVLTLFSCNQAYPRFSVGYIATSGKRLHSIRNGYDLSKMVKIL
jgi:Calcineurin-like phosphoesterase